MDSYEEMEYREQHLEELIELKQRIKVLKDVGSALIADVKSRHPGEELRCQYMRALDAALQEQTNAD